MGFDYRDELLIRRKDDLLDICARGSRKLTGDQRAELLQYGYGDEAIRERRAELGITEPEQLPELMSVKAKYRQDQSRKRLLNYPAAVAHIQHKE